MPPLSFYVYILASQSGVLYAGVTRNLLRRVYQHRKELIPGFTKRYHVNRLVYFESTPSARAAFERAPDQNLVEVKEDRADRAFE